MYSSGSGKQIYSPAISVDGGTVFATCNNGVLFAIDSRDGSLKWNYSTNVDQLHGLQSSPVVHPTNGVGGNA